MRTTVAVDDGLLVRAQAFTGLKEKSALIREALGALTALVAPVRRCPDGAWS